MTKDLREFLTQIKKTKDLMVIKKKVSSKYEIAALTAHAEGGKALLFENIKESKFRLVSNLVGTRNRFSLAVGAKKDIHEPIIKAIKNASKPKTTTSGKFFENSATDLSILPIVTHFAKESGPFITSSIVYSKNPELRAQNSSFHRLMPIDKKHFSIRMVEGRHLHRNFISAKEHGEDLKVAIAVGVHPQFQLLVHTRLIGEKMNWKLQIRFYQKNSHL